MHTIDVYVDEDDRRRKRRRGKWLLPLLVGVMAAFALGREKPPDPAPPKPVVVPPPPIEQQTAVTPPAPAPALETVAPVPTAPLIPAHLAAGPLLLDFGEGPLTRGVPARMVTIRNDGGQPLPRVAVAVDPPFLATNGCTTELAPGDQCMIAVVFAPSQPGKFARVLKIAAGGESAKIPLRGSVPRPREVVVPPPQQQPVPAPVAQVPSRPVPPPLPPPRRLCFQPAGLVFTNTRKQTVTLTNPETTPIRVAGVAPVDREGLALTGFELDLRKCLRILKPGQQCRFTVRATEGALEQRARMHLRVYYDDPLTGGTRVAFTTTTCGGQ